MFYRLKQGNYTREEAARWGLSVPSSLRLPVVSFRGWWNDEMLTVLLAGSGVSFWVDVVMIPSGNIFTLAKDSSTPTPMRITRTGTRSTEKQQKRSSKS